MSPTRRVGRRRHDPRPGLLTAAEAIARDPILNYKRLWEAELGGRLHPMRNG